MFKNYFDKKLYTEEYSMGEFTMGFELEAWVSDLELKRNVDQAFYSWWQGNKDKRTIDLSTIDLGNDPTIIPEDQKEDCEYCDGTGIVYDYNGEEEKCEECEGRGFVREYNGDDITYEWSSPVLNITPANLQKVVNFLNFGIREGYINTNETCGFHIHLGFPDQSTRSMDIMWVLSHLMMDQEQLKNILRFNNIKLSNESYAEFNFLIQFRRKIEKIQKEYNLSKDKSEQQGYIKDILKTTFERFYVGTKYRILRQHTQGTLEWRGSRGFMDNYKTQDVKDFLYKKFYPFAKWMNKKLDEQVLILGDTLSITKTEFYDMLKYVEAPSQKENYKLKNKKRRQNKFLYMQDMEMVEKIYKQFPQINKWIFDEGHFNINGEKLEIISGNFYFGTVIDNCIIYNINLNNNIKILNSTILGNIIISGEVIFENCKTDDIIFEVFRGTSTVFINDCNFVETLIKANSTVKITGGTYNNCKFINNVVVNSGFFNDCMWDAVPENWKGGEWHKGSVKILHPDGGNRNPLDIIHDLNPIDAYKKFIDSNKYEDDVFEEYIIRGKQ